MSRSYAHLLQPGRIGPMTVRNRMLVTAMGVNLAEDDGTCGDRIRNFHAEQARGGVGLVVMGVAGVGWPHGGNLPRQVAISEDRFIPGLKNVVDAVHAHGAKIATQLHHGGLVSVQDMLEGRPVWVPSYPYPKQGDFQDGILAEEFERSPAAAMSREIQLHPMTTDDIRELVAKFAAAAGRAKQAGFDGLEIHGGHGYIISSFLSPLTNQRDDEYGGSLENRARLLLEIIRAVRAEVGPEIAVWCKLDSGEFGVPEGISLTDAIATAKLAEAAGADAITVSAYHDTSKGILHSESNIPHIPERMVPNATAIKAALSIPVIASGRIEPERADQHIEAGHFDFLGMGRKMLADPHLPRKLSDGRPQDIRPCVYCYCCVSQIYVQASVKCAVNADTAYEQERALVPTAQPKHVAVVGGGPAGMEAARRLSLRGHRVTLLEQSDRLGGTVQFASIAYEPNERILKWLKRQIAQSAVHVRLNTRATPQLLKSMAVEEVVVATGAVREMPPIPGADQDWVFSGDDMRDLVLGQNLEQLEHKVSTNARRLTRLGALTRATRSPAIVRRFSEYWMPLDRRIVILGAELVGLELAEFLAHRGREVTVIDEAPKPGAGLYIVRRLRLLDELRDAGVMILSSARDIEIGDHVVSYTNFRRQRRSVAADQVIVARGATGNTALADELRNAGLSVHTIGDCNGVGYIEGAMESAAELAVKL